MTPLETLRGLTLPAMREQVKELGDDVKEFVAELVVAVGGTKEKKEGKKGKGKKGKETEVAEEETVSFIDCFVKVTDFGGPLFKPYDRRDEERNGR